MDRGDRGGSGGGGSGGVTGVRCTPEQEDEDAGVCFLFLHELL